MFLKAIRRFQHRFHRFQHSTSIIVVSNRFSFSTLNQLKVKNILLNQAIIINRSLVNLLSILLISFLWTKTCFRKRITIIKTSTSVFDNELSFEILWINSLTHLIHLNYQIFKTRRRRKTSTTTIITSIAEMSMKLIFSILTTMTSLSSLKKSWNMLTKTFIFVTSMIS